MRAGAIAAGAGRGALAALAEYARRVGLGFQIVDDLLDVEGDADVVGKPVRADAAADKPTYPAVAGIAAAKARALELRDLAIAALAAFGPEADGLRDVTHFIVERRQ